MRGSNNAIAFNIETTYYIKSNKKGLNNVVSSSKKTYRIRSFV